VTLTCEKPQWPVSEANLEERRTFPQSREAQAEKEESPA